MEKIEHISKMFNKRTTNKDYENFVVNAIYARINNPELLPVTQQYVRNITSKEYYLLDLYFPQLNYGIEVDESQHLQEEHKGADKKRAEAIQTTIDCDEGRISIFKEVEKTDNKKKCELRTYKDINSQIDREVEKIKKMIAEKEARGEKLIWKDNDELKSEVIARGSFRTDDQVDYKGITEIYNITGHPAKSLSTCFIRLNTKYKLWVPHLTITMDDGSMNTVNNWVNTLNADRTEITEVDRNGNRYDVPEGPSNEDFQRIVFMHLKDKFGLPCIRFIGVFEAFDTRYVKDGCLRRYRRIATEIDISDVFPQPAEKKNESSLQENTGKIAKEKANTYVPETSNKQRNKTTTNRAIDPMHQSGYTSFENIAVSDWEVQDWINFIERLKTRVRYTDFGKHITQFWFIMSVIKSFGGNPHTDIGLEINTKKLVIKLYVNDKITDRNKKTAFQRQQRNSIERYLTGIRDEFQEYNIKYHKKTGRSVIIFEIMDFPITRDGQRIDMEKIIELIEKVRSKFEIVVPKWSNKLIEDRNNT